MGWPGSATAGLVPVAPGLAGWAWLLEAASHPHHRCFQYTTGA
nr:hypothetical protein JVH1_3803 [Rhodococcus sp. JVH1]